MILEGRTYQQIAGTLHTSSITTREDARALFKSHKVQTRTQLLHTLMPTPAAT